MRILVIGLESSDNTELTNEKINNCFHSMKIAVSSFGVKMVPTNMLAWVTSPPENNPSTPDTTKEQIPAETTKSDKEVPIKLHTHALENLRKLGVYTYHDIQEKMTLVDMYTIDGLSFHTLTGLWKDMVRHGVTSFKCGKTINDMNQQEMINTGNRSTNPMKFKFKCVPPKKMLNILLKYVMSVKYQKIELLAPEMFGYDVVIEEKHRKRINKWMYFTIQWLLVCGNKYLENAVRSIYPGSYIDKMNKLRHYNKSVDNQFVIELRDFIKTIPEELYSPDDVYVQRVVDEDEDDSDNGTIEKAA